MHNKFLNIHPDVLHLYEGRNLSGLDENHAGGVLATAVLLMPWLRLRSNSAVFVERKRLQHLLRSCTFGRAAPRVSMRDMFEKRRRASRSAAALTAAVLLAAAVAARAQGAGSGIPLNQNNNPGQTNLQNVQQVQQQLQTPGPAISPQGSSGAVDQSFHGSLVSGKATADVLPLSLDDAIQRGLKNNLGLILQSSNEKNASGEAAAGVAASAADGDGRGFDRSGAGEPRGVRPEVSGDQPDCGAVPGSGFSRVSDAEPGEPAGVRELHAVEAQLRVGQIDCAGRARSGGADGGQCLPAEPGR